MCNSSFEGKQWTKKYVQQYLRNVPNPRLLDIGTGKGTYYDLLYQHFPNAHWTGVEAYKQYIDSYQLNKKYHTMHHADVRELYSPNTDVTQLHYHVAFCGDVLEHMTKNEALALLEKLTSCTDIIVISIPIIKWPQHDEANPFQEHVKDDWTHQEAIDSFPNIIDHTQGVSIGVYIVAGDHYKQKEQ